MDTNRGMPPHLEPEISIEIIDRIHNARAIALEELDELNEVGDTGLLSVNPKTMGELYGFSERGVVRYLAKGRQYFERKIQNKQREWSPAYALAPEGVSLAAFDLYMFEVEQCIDDGQKIRRAYQSPAMCRRHPCARLFSLTLLRKCFKAWSEEYHQRDDRGDGREISTFDLVKIPKTL